MKFETNSNSSIQIWFSGKEQSWEIAPCILNIEGEDNRLSVYRTLNTHNQIAIYLNGELLESVELELINFTISGSTLLGDMNSDGFINILDIVILSNNILSNENNSIGDINQDSYINILDIVILVNIILGNG